MANEVNFGNSALHEMARGIEIGATAVGITMGGNGKTVFLYKQNVHLEATKDGVTVINNIRLSDLLQDAGLKLVQDISSKTAMQVGDGTSGVCVLMNEIVSEGLKLKQSGLNVIELKKGMDKATKSIVDSIKLMSKKIGNDKKLLKQVATVSSNNDIEIGDYIGNIYEKLGKNASIVVEDGNAIDTVVELVNGFQFLGGYLSDYFINTPNNTSELVNPYVLIIDGKVEQMSSITPIMEKVVTEGRSLVIMADDFHSYVQADFLKNIQRNVINGYLIKHQFSGETKDELLLDLCAFMGATLITEKTGKKIENIDTSYLGQCEKIISKKTETTIFNGKSNKKEVDLRISDCHNKIKSASNQFLKEKFELRLAKLSGAVAIYYVGGATKVEVGEKMARIDDAIRATRCAVEEGVVCGGGSTLLKCIKNLEKLQWDSEDERSGIKLIQKSIEKPFWQICKNAGASADLLLEKVKEKGGNFGYNCKTNKIEDLMEAGIVDPAKVVRVCVENAISGAAQFLISECVITDEITNQ